MTNYCATVAISTKLWFLPSHTPPEIHWPFTHLEPIVLRGAYRFIVIYVSNIDILIQQRLGWLRLIDVINYIVWQLNNSNKVILKVIFKLFLQSLENSITITATNAFRLFHSDMQDHTPLSHYWSHNGNNVVLYRLSTKIQNHYAFGGPFSSLKLFFLYRF